MQCPTAKCKCSVPQQSVNAEKCKCSVPQQWVHYISPWCKWTLFQFLCVCVEWAWAKGHACIHECGRGGGGRCVHANVLEGEINGRRLFFIFFSKLSSQKRKEKQTNRKTERKGRVAGTKEYHEHNVFFHSSVPQWNSECVCTSALLLQTSVSSVQYSSRGPHVTSLHL